MSHFAGVSAGAAVLAALRMVLVAERVAQWRLQRKILQ